MVTFSPCHEIDEAVEVPGYDVEISDYSIYSYGTKTVVIRKNMLYGEGKIKAAKKLFFFEQIV